MAQIIFVSDNADTKKEIEVLGIKTPHILNFISDENILEEMIKNDKADIIIFDYASINIDIIALVRKMKISL